jgi:hypothetical protein
MAWSSLDLAGHCLSDRARTDALIAALRTVVRPGDVVLDAGAGSGVLSLAAAHMGASHVVAVEKNSLLCTLLHEESRRQGIAVEVVCEDLTGLQLFPVDVLVAELIDVWLLEEEFARAVCYLRSVGIIEERTWIVPLGYSFHLELGRCEWADYRRKLRFPYYEWQSYTDESWDVPRFDCLVGWRNIGRVESLDIADSGQRALQFTLSLSPEQAITLAQANALRLSGTVHLCEGNSVESTGAMNSPLVVPLKDGAFLPTVGDLVISATMSEGVASLNVLINGTRILSW